MELQQNSKTHSRLLNLRRTRPRQYASSTCSLPTQDKPTHSRTDSLTSVDKRAIFTVPVTIESSGIFDFAVSPKKGSPRKQPATFSHAEVIEHKVNSRNLTTKTSSNTLSSTDFTRLAESKSSTQRTFNHKRSISNLELGSVSPVCRRRLSQFEELDNMIETANVAVIKAYMKNSQRDFSRKLNSLKHLAQIDKLQAKASQAKRWRKARFTTTKEEKDFTNKQIKEIAGEWRREMKRFLF